MRDLLRTVKLRPYRKGAGPTFTLVTWDTGRIDGDGKSILGYEFRQHTAKSGRHADTIVLFTGEDFCCSPLYAIDSDRCLATLLGFLTLRPGDTDTEYFDTYTAAQLAYCAEHAESLGAEVIARFGED